MKNIPLSIVIAGILIFGLAMFALGAYVLKIPVTCEVISYDELAVYGPPLYEEPIHGIQFAIFRKGTGQSMVLMVSNNGTQALDVTMLTDPEVIDWAEVSFTPAHLGILEPGGSVNTTLAIYVPRTTPVGDYEFDILLDAK